MAIAVATFVIALGLIATERLHRTKVALLGAAIVVLFVGEFSQEKAIEAVDFNTIGLLAGMMILVYLTQQTGVYDFIAIRAGQLSRGRPVAVVMSLAGTTALLSAFLDNLTTMLLVIPITFLLADALDIDPIPLLIVIEVIASNIGGTATLIGDPPNIIIAGRTGLSFNDFIFNLAPIVFAVFIVVIPLLYLWYRPQLQIEERNRHSSWISTRRPRSATLPSFAEPGPCWSLTILAFFTHQALHIEPATVALTGAAVGLLVTRFDLRGARRDRVADPLLLRRALRHGRRARGDRRDRRGGRRASRT